MHRNLLLALLTLSTTALLANKSTARVHPAADVKASQAETTETDVKVIHNDALPYFEQWVRSQPQCPDECNYFKRNDSEYCPHHCSKRCIDGLRDNKLCSRLRNLAYNSFFANNHMMGASISQCGSIALTHHPKQMAPRICAALPTLPPELAMIIANYTPERIILFTVWRDAFIRQDGRALHYTNTIQYTCSCNGITQDRYSYTYQTGNECAYNVDTNQLVTLSTAYTRTKHREGVPIGTEWSETPDFSNSSEPKECCTVQ